MRDKFQKAIHKKIFNVKKEPVSPNDSLWLNGIRVGTVLKVNLSMDNAEKFINTFGDPRFYIDVPINITIYDEGLISSREELLKRYKVISILNDLPIVSVRFNLSDENISLYSMALSQMRFNHPDKTVVGMSLDRNPLGDKTKLNLKEFPGFIDIKEEDLISLEYSELLKLQGKTTNPKVPNSAIGLKTIVEEFVEDASNKYYLNDLDDYEKILMAFIFMSDNIRFADEFVFRTQDGKQHLKGDAPSSVSEPLLTYINKSGVCSGWARLLKTLLNNEYIKVPSLTIKGRAPEGPHMWVGSVVDDCLFETCPTLRGPFEPLRSLGYFCDRDEIYPRVYPNASLKNEDKIKLINRLALKTK